MKHFSVISIALAHTHWDHSINRCDPEQAEAESLTDDSQCGKIARDPPPCQLMNIPRHNF